jgi:hypothetical protein
VERCFAQWQAGLLLLLALLDGHGHLYRGLIVGQLHVHAVLGEAVMGP